MSTDPAQLEQRISTLEAKNEALERMLVETAGAARRRRPRRDWDGVAAVVASFVGLLALAVSAYTAYVQRQQLRAEVWPKMIIGNSNIDLKIAAANQGTGPARVTAVRVAVDGKPVKTWGEVEAAFGGGDDTRIVYSSLNGQVIAADKHIVIANPEKDEASRAMFGRLLAREGHSFAITVCYCSVLDDCWVVHHGAAPPEHERQLPPDQCPIAESEQFRN